MFRKIRSQRPRLTGDRTIDYCRILLYKESVKPKYPQILLAVVVLTAFTVGVCMECLAAPTLIQANRPSFERHITTAAERYIGTTYAMGRRDATTGALDNSRLFNLIYLEAAEKAGMRYLGYAPMEKLLERTLPVSPDKIRIGDMVVLQNGLAAMIYKFDNPEKFHMIYASQQRQRVISFNSRNLVCEVYWMKHLKGYYRLTPYNFFPAR